MRSLNAFEMKSMIWIRVYDRISIMVNVGKDEKDCMCVKVIEKEGEIFRLKNDPKGRSTA